MNYGRLYRDLAKRGWTYEEISDMTFPQIANEFESDKPIGGYHPSFPGVSVALCNTWEEVRAVQNLVRRK